MANKKNNNSEIVSFSMEYYDKEARAKILETLYHQNYNYRSINEENKVSNLRKLKEACKKGTYGDFYKAAFTDGFITTLAVLDDEYFSFSNLHDIEINFSGFVRKMDLISDIFWNNNFIEDISLDRMVTDFMTKNCVQSIILMKDKDSGGSSYRLRVDQYRLRKLNGEEKNRIADLDGKTFDNLDQLIMFIKSYTSDINVGI